MLRVLRYLWASPVTLVGLVGCLAAVHRGTIRGVDGVLEAEGPILRAVLSRFPIGPCGASAITFGHVILGQSPEDLDWSRKHEHVHVRQFERWGVFLGVAYPLASLWMWLRGKNPYRDNPFEREAYGSDDA